MRISLIGMSHVGKTYWAKKLEEKGFIRFSCDDFIEEKLKAELAQSGYSGIEGVSKWMGQPYDFQYSGASKKYLELEILSLRNILSDIDNLNGQNVVIDTTGSVIHTGQEVMQNLARKTRILELDTPESVKQEMYKSYLINPKPVIWGDVYKKFDDESTEQALARCYPLLLDYRTRKYKKYAHVSLNYFLLRQKDFSTENFLNLLFSLEEKI
ncbi:hypothetical protein A2960_04900 [Candidatus Gottesmanbacteria bacterium RIFCSPLOWO2_01_FULL_39_12b]|uniref:Shikimate kinase n=1 Tax=Candidatus Gottesmanbacteria bacterium RIFCSPLOWO2_01_FULL_39_12b TaxID=1798388 RepID=A0A1F6AP80_9BACT|nr:MAG: hypothetical protein A2960_04900 [Candidatus Gottesmanbacteria bacterium RIFCSPLOWO2_01_FULL_39_12b]